MNRLRSYRLIEGITQKELAEKLEVSRQLISAIESRRRSPTLDLTSLGYREFEVPAMIEPLHRQRARTRLATSQRAKELLRLAGEVYNELKRHTPRFESLAAWMREDPNVIECVRDVRVGALQQEEGMPIRNLTAAIERAGVCLVPLVGFDGIDGISSWVNGLPVIGVNIDGVPGDRLRMSLAHELGHLAMHERRTLVSENEAYRFASALLISDEDFESAMEIGHRSTMHDFIKLKAAWGISISALVVRAHRDGYLDDREYRAMHVRMSRWRQKEPVAVKPVYGRMLRGLVKDNGGLHECSTRLGINTNHLRRLVSWRPPLQLVYR